MSFPISAHILFQDSIQDIYHIGLVVTSPQLRAIYNSFSVFLILILSDLHGLWSISGHPVECPAVRASLMSSRDSTGVTGFGEGYYRGEVPFLYHLISGGRLCRYDIMNDVGLHHLAKAGFPRFLHAKVILFTLPYSFLWKQITESNPH